MFDGFALPGLRTTAAMRRELDPLDPINRGLLRCFPLDEPGGAVLDDLSPARKRGSVVGVVSRLATTRGRATNFPSSGRYGLASSTKIVSGKPRWTIALWARIPSGYSSFAGSCFYCERASAGNDIVKLDGMSSGLGFTNIPFITLRDDAGTLIQGCQASTAVNDGRWHFLVATKAGGSLSIYVDGRVENTAAWGGTDTFNNSGIDSRIASDQAAPGDSAYGDYSRVRLYDRALRQSEITRLYRDPWAGTFDPAERLFVTLKGSGAAVPIEGTLAATLADVTLSATGTLPIVGTAAVTLGAATLSSAATLAIAGTLSATLADATLTATGALPIVGTAAITLGATTLSATGALPIVGAVAVTLDSATLAATGVLPIVGTAAITLADATLTAAGTLPIVGQAAATLADASLSATGALAIAGVLAVTLGNVTLVAYESATVADPAPASRTVTWRAHDRIAAWPAESRTVTWPAHDRTVEWQE